MRERWAEHPLGSLAHVLLAQLRAIAGVQEPDRRKRCVWARSCTFEGPESLKARAAEMNFVEGAQYSETVRNERHRDGARS